ncbi:VOC family protein [Cronobacter muytjensii]|nr:VOC family protein [Cronobacter muytjensii]
MAFTHMRIARPVTDLEKSFRLWSQGLGLVKLAAFTDHAGFSGIMLGRKDLPWHLEFTVCHDHPVAPSPGNEDLLVLYYPDNAEWQRVCASLEGAGFISTPSFNPYWDINGRTWMDHDGYRLVVQNRAWE